uniref:tRNA-splicing endonuclease subunit Sen34 n=1 Tax=Oncorhynchus kisutch TaxID=8019 RepID=A0A8C7FA16_ONCKI
MDSPEQKITKTVSRVDASKESMANSRQVIGINFCGPTPLMWRADDLKSVRELGIIGTLVGSLARQPRQNTRLGRPLELLPEEGRLLADMGRAAVIPDSTNEDPEVNPEQVEQYHAGLENSFQEQGALALEDRKATLMRVMTKKHNGKETSSLTYRHLCETSELSVLALTALCFLLENSGSQEDSDGAVRDRLEALAHGFSFPRPAMAVQLCTARAGLSHCPEVRRFLAADWPIPRDERSETRFRVFRDLRRQGFYLTSAGKFGGDYLVYPGDPLRFHAYFIVVCISMDESMPLCDVLAIARLGSNVKKTVLLCSSGGSQEDDGEEVVYTSLQWSGMV